MHINDLLKIAVESGASDLHLSVNSPPVLRIHGELVRLKMPPLTVEEVTALVQQTLNQDLLDRFRENGEVDFSYSVRGLGRFRLNVFLQRGTPSLAARVIPPHIRSLDELGIPPVVKELAFKPHGLVLVTGPTGSGKSTTLAAMIDLINRQCFKHIITLEDPIEYLHSHRNCIINQREIGQDSRSFASALRVALRQDPDVILVGEMRDLETIATAITAAETGHLVLATLHTPNAVQTVDRIIDVFPPHQQQQVRIQLSMVLQGVVSQQLIPKADRTGRVVATEILIAIPAVRNLIREGKTHQLLSVMQSGAKYGMHTMDQSLRDLYLSRQITYEEAISRASDKENFASLLNAGYGDDGRNGQGRTGAKYGW
ncbi:MAG: twitching motility protein PilT [Eubacteriales bacterium]|nr:twitching motility protein PilT [Eubacteriales bacterium]MDN5364242.1 twitching motility protein PilT [Eubacteriales bacterium]